MQFNSIDEAFNWLLSINDSDKPGALMVDGHAASLKELQDINFQAISFIKDCWKQDKTRELPDSQLMDMTKKIIKNHDEYIIVRLYEAFKFIEDHINTKDI